MDSTNISTANLVYVYILAFIMIGVMTFNQISITKKAIVAIVRMTLQLILASVVLMYIFDANSLIITSLVYFFMISFATYTAATNSKLKMKGKFAIILSALLISSTLVLGFLLVVVIRPEPFYNARYLIPLAGMIMGNSMNASALALERFVSELSISYLDVEHKLALGATPFEAVIPYIRKGVGAAVTPTITTMLSTGVVSIPGMMSGQILAGVAPAEAIKYQMVVMLGIFITLSITISIVLLRGYKLFFTKESQLKSEQLH